MIYEIYLKNKKYFNTLIIKNNSLIIWYINVIIVILITSYNHYKIHKIIIITNIGI